MRKIFVMGGGGFAMEPENPLLDNYILSLSEKNKPKICFIGTATGDSEWYQDKFYSAYEKLECETTHLSLFKPTTRDFDSLVREQDIIHVGGGNTKNLLCLWREWGLDKAILGAYQDGEVVLTGMSAGMICWFEDGVTDSFGDKLDYLAGLGVLKGSACPHFDGEEDRRPTYTNMLKENGLKSGIALDDGVGALYLNEELKECVSSRENSKAYFFHEKTAKEESLAVKFLGA